MYSSSLFPFLSHTKSLKKGNACSKQILGWPRKVGFYFNYFFVILESNCCVLVWAAMLVLVCCTESLPNLLLAASLLFLLTLLVNTILSRSLAVFVTMLHPLLLHLLWFLHNLLLLCNYLPSLHSLHLNLLFNLNQCQFFLNKNLFQNNSKPIFLMIKKKIFLYDLKYNHHLLFQFTL